MSDEAVWHDNLGLNDDDAAYLSGKGVKSAGDFVASYRELERYQGNSIALPGAAAGPEDWARIHNRLGRPETADGYDFGDVSGMDDAGRAELDWYRGVAHELGLSQQQAVEFVSRYAQRGAEQVQAATAARTAAEAAALAELHAEWGAAAERNTALAAQAVRALGLSQDEVDAMAESPGGKASLARALAKIAPQLGEDVQVGKGRSGDLSLSKADAQARITGIYGDPEHPYHQADHPGHRAAVETMQGYFQAANPAEAAA
ncbi:MAG: hypothetical protein O2967_17720 [Proteobacteria bacterium]|nr:hypothetical protein [Pseudomonadota bacterium]